tara:strand:+ start:113 stop:349 length:237 start_codon:yes stop_codon:yes gene_type:complete
MGTNVYKVTVKHETTTVYAVNAVSPEDAQAVVEYADQDELDELPSEASSESLEIEDVALHSVTALDLLIAQRFGGITT